MRITLIALFLFLIASLVFAQAYPEDNTLPSSNSGSGLLPQIDFEMENYYLAHAFYRDYATGEFDVKAEIALIDRRSAPLIVKWDSLGDAILTTISALSEIPWREPVIKIHLLKYLPVSGIYEPLAIPVEGVKIEGRIEAVPSGWFQFLQLIQYLAGRNILQCRFHGFERPLIADHPLLDQGIYRFDIMATHLALSTVNRIIPPDSLAFILSSERWKKLNPGWELYKDNFEKKWALSAEKPLVSYLEQEPYNSPLVELTSAPKESEEIGGRKPLKRKKIPSEGKGRLGFSIVRSRGGTFEVTLIDSERLAYACGLRGGDRIQRVNGELAKNQRELMEKIIDSIDGIGAYLLILREKESKGILLQSVPKSDNL
jgi:hypothetical protein